MEAKTIEMISKLIQTVGFPILVAIWFMFRSDKRQDKLIELVNSLARAKQSGDATEKD